MANVAAYENEIQLIKAAQELGAIGDTYLGRTIWAASHIGSWMANLED